MACIYKIQNLQNGKIYVGQTVHTAEARFAKHKQAALRGVASKLYNAIRKYGEKQFSVITIEICDPSVLNIREQYHIRQLDSYVNGYNMTTGGDSYSYEFSDADRKKMSEAAKKRWENEEEERQRYSERQQRRWKNSEYRSRVSTKISTTMTQVAQTDRVQRRERMLEIMKDPAQRKRRSEANVRYFENSSNRSQRTKQLQERWETHREQLLHKRQGFHYHIKSPTGEEWTVIDLVAWCAKHELPHSSIYKLSKTPVTSKSRFWGWTVKRIEGKTDER